MLGIAAADGLRGKGKPIEEEDFIARKKYLPVPRANFRIRYPQVRVIGADGEQLGVLPTREAIKIAEDNGLDLVEISSTARPPVCRIMDLGKYKYEQSKTGRKARKKQQATTLKEMRFRPKIDKHDVEFKTRHVREFLEEGHKVKVYVEFRGREVTHTEYGTKILNRIEKLLEGIGIVENRPKMEGRHMTMLFVPKKSGTRKKKSKPAAVKDQTPSPAGQETENLPSVGPAVPSVAPPPETNHPGETSPRLA